MKRSALHLLIISLVIAMKPVIAEIPPPGMAFRAQVAPNTFQIDAINDNGKGEMTKRHLLVDMGGVFSIVEDGVLSKFKIIAFDPGKVPRLKLKHLQTGKIFWLPKALRKKDEDQDRARVAFRRGPTSRQRS